VASTEVAVAQNHGEVFTRRWVVDALLDLTGYTSDRDLGALTLVEPAAGTGAFLFPAVERLLESLRTHRRDPGTLTNAIRAWELQSHNVTSCRSVVSAMLTSAGVDEDVAIALSEKWIIHGDFLLPEGDLFTSGSGTIDADIVIGNPPYIRLEDLPHATSTAYRRRWSTMGGRADIYIGFIERALSMLRPGGRVGFICADRWMRNQYGDRLRRMVSDGYAIDAVWAMHDVDAFESRVSAYPAITVFRRGTQSEVIAADTTGAFGESSAEKLVTWSTETNGRHFEARGVSAHRLPHWFSGQESWPNGSPARLRLIEYLNDNFPPLHDPSTGTKVGIGVATGADKVFVTTNTEIVERDRLLPLSLARDLKSGTFQWSGHYLVDPWNERGKLVALKDFPRLREYLDTESECIRARHVASKSPSNWYRTIDKVHHELTVRPKLLIQDMRSEINPVLEGGGFYPHHNLYYVTSTVWDMEVLGGLLLSRIAQAFIEAYCVRMRGGTLRFQSQYLKRIRVPAPDSISDQCAQALRTAFRSRDRNAATLAASQAYGIV
jgi:hypothetical protein